MTNVDDKYREKVQLLMRLYCLEDIYKLGKSLNISYFDQFRNYWDIDYAKGYQKAASEIARVISDDDLLRIIKQKPPSYRLIGLGGFQGNYYSSTERGDVILESSWDNVRKNTRTALEKWKGQAYGLLKVIINKGGKSAYFDLIDAIEKVLEYEFVPSYLLPRLGPLKLVFKTGSNKYPDWTMPPEIIPVVGEELLQYKSTPKVFRPSRAPIDEKDASVLVIHSERIVRGIVDRIVRVRRDIALLFSSQFETKTKLFKQNEIAIVDILKLCANEDDFNNRILSLSTLIVGIENDVVKAQIKGQHDDLRGSIAILEAWLEEARPDYDTKMIKGLRMIQRLRSKKYPIHEDTPEFIKALQYFGFIYPVNDWQALWEAVLSEYLQTLGKIREIIGIRQPLKYNRKHKLRC